MLVEAEARCSCEIHRLRPTADVGLVREAHLKTWALGANIRRLWVYLVETRASQKIASRRLLETLEVEVKGARCLKGRLPVGLGSALGDRYVF